MAMSPKGKRRNSLILLSILVTLFVTVSGVAIVLFMQPSLFIKLLASGKLPASGDSGIGVTILDGEPIGISDGSYAFDVKQKRPGGDLKRQASDKFKRGDIVGAESLWEQAKKIDTNDAEVLIYLENQRVRDSGSPYITLVVGTMLTGEKRSNISTGRDNLQGAYVAQKEYNDGFKLGGGVQILLLVANSGSNKDYATTVAQQIVQAAKQDQHIVGVMGWSFSSHALKAVDVLSKAGIPMVSPTASSDELTGKSRFFFRVAPSNMRQAIVGAQYAEDQLHARRVALFFDLKDAYSKNLAEDFEKQFHYQIVAKEEYTVGKLETLPTLLQAALDAKPDLIYFAGYAGDMSVLLANLPTSQPYLPLMGGDALYELNAYSDSARVNFNHLRFTAFAYPDEWKIQGLQEPLFFKKYPEYFDPKGQHPSSDPYGYTRANDKVILSYDATLALLEGCKKVLTGVTPSALRQSLAGIDRSHRIQGVSGQIAFGSDGDPIDKAVLALYVDLDRHIHMADKKGCFRVEDPCAS